jgi:hypothetical protein
MGGRQQRGFVISRSPDQVGSGSKILRKLTCYLGFLRAALRRSPVTRRSRWTGGSGKACSRRDCISFASRIRSRAFSTRALISIRVSSDIHEHDNKARMRLKSWKNCSDAADERSNCGRESVAVWRGPVLIVGRVHGANLRRNSATRRRCASMSRARKPRSSRTSRSGVRLWSTF